VSVTPSDFIELNDVGSSAVLSAIDGSFDCLGMLCTVVGNSLGSLSPQALGSFQHIIGIAPKPLQAFPRQALGDQQGQEFRIHASHIKPMQGD
jgi:hypothetical protein